MRIIYLAHLSVLALLVACAESESEVESPGTLSLVKSDALAGGAAGLLTPSGVDALITYAGASEVYLTNASSSWPSPPDLESPAVVAVAETDDGLVTVDAAGTWRWRDSEGVAQSLAGPTPLRLIRSGDALYAPLGPGGVVTAPTDLTTPPTLLPGLEGTSPWARRHPRPRRHAPGALATRARRRRRLGDREPKGGDHDGARRSRPEGALPLLRDPAPRTHGVVARAARRRRPQRGGQRHDPLSGSCRSLETEPNIHWVFVACTDRLHVLDLSNPTRPVRTGTLVLGGERVLGVVEYTDEERLVRGRDDVSWVGL